MLLYLLTTEREREIFVLTIHLFDWTLSCEKLTSLQRLGIGLKYHFIQFQFVCLTFFYTLLKVWNFQKESTNN